MKKEVPKQEEEIKKIGEKHKTSELIAPTIYWIYYSCDRPFTCDLHSYVMVT